MVWISLAFTGMLAVNNTVLILLWHIGSMHSTGCSVVYYIDCTAAFVNN